MTDTSTEPMTEPREQAVQVPGEPSPGRPIRDLPPVTERDLAARARGLASAYIDGGDDPDPELTRRREARYWRLMFLMLGLIVGSTVIFTILDIASGGLGK